MKRVVIKIGTKVISRDDGTLDVALMRHLVEQVAAARKKGVKIILITSGAVGAGRSVLPAKRPSYTPEKQVHAAVGQVKLMSIYSKLFEKEKLLCAQVLVTKEDFRDRVHYQNMKNCFEALLASGVVPIVNENDVTATTELLFTDNDELAGLVATQLDANAVIILTNTDGVLDQDKKVISEIRSSNAARVEASISPTTNTFGRGGMLTKYRIARKLARKGIAVSIANGKRKNIIRDLLAGKSLGTRFS
jgi:glutamate 5-kinase